MAKTKIECNDCGDFNNYVYHQGGGEYLCCECLTKKLREADKIIQELLKGQCHPACEAKLDELKKQVEASTPTPDAGRMGQ